MIKPSKLTGKLLNKAALSTKTTLVTIEITEPKDFLFRPGQFVTIEVADKVLRPYSICSDANDLPIISLAIETGHEGAGSNYIKKLPIGNEMKLFGPSGRLLLPEKPFDGLPDKLYFLATGTGIASFISIFSQLVDLNYQGQITLLFGVRRETEMIFKNELEMFKAKLKNFRYKVSFSKPENPSTPAERITYALPTLTDKNTLYFLCGHPLMIEEVLKGLEANGIGPDRVVKEEFTHPKQTHIT